MPFPFVSRSVYDDLQRRYDALFEKYDALRMAGAVPTPPRAQPTGPSPEAIAAQRRHMEQIQQLAKEIATDPRVRSGTDAMSEAMRMLGDVHGQGLP